MDNNNLEQKSITERIDQDKGLESKRKLVTIVSCILLGISLSGAKIIDANTFVFRIEFENQEGLTHLLLASLIFLLVRYYNYAKPYHRVLKRLWAERMEDEKLYFQGYELDLDEFGTGLIVELAPREFLSAFAHSKLATDAHHMAFSFTYIPSIRPKVLYEVRPVKVLDLATSSLTY